jgi:hypothetical protein
MIKIILSFFDINIYTLLDTKYNNCLKKDSFETFDFRKIIKI